MRRTLICDRAVLDNYCYLVNKFGRQPQLENWLNWWMKSYSLIVSVPPMARRHPPDGFRAENVEFQLRIHDLIGDTLAELPFSAHHDRVLWLDRRDRRVWGKSHLQQSRRFYVQHCATKPSRLASSTCFSLCGFCIQPSRGALKLKGNCVSDL